MEKNITLHILPEDAGKLPNAIIISALNRDGYKDVKIQGHYWEAKKKWLLFFKRKICGEIPYGTMSRLIEYSFGPFISSAAIVLEKYH